jgi:hypothetical protein
MTAWKFQVGETLMNQVKSVTQQLSDREENTGKQHT